ncbi:hypothetical protein, partial [Bifidobacterium adolescentis]|uniref:hypothetical protein n=1 Tax=Bifidobacterium adolescentis TaxID=1680 RepID=UPI0034A39F5D
RTQDAGHALLRQGRNPKVRKNSGVIHPEQHNRAWEMLLPKMRTSHDGKLEGYGLKIYPQFDPTE